MQFTFTDFRHQLLLFHNMYVRVCMYVCVGVKGRVTL